jgi:hypothetical protein
MIGLVRKAILDDPGRRYSMDFDTTNTINGLNKNSYAKIYH